MTTRVYPARFAPLLALALSLGGYLPLSWAQSSSPTPGPVTAPAVGQPTAAQSFHDQLRQFYAQLPLELTPMQRRDAVRQYVETNFPAGLAAVSDSAAALPADRVPGPLVIPANATIAQTAASSARHQLAQVLYDAKAVLRDNPNATPKQRRDYVRDWLETQGLPLWLQARQTAQTAGQEKQQAALQRLRDRIAASANSPASVAIVPAAGVNLTPAAALALRGALSAEAQRIAAQANVTTPGQRRTALRQWYEANKARIDAIRVALAQTSPPVPAVNAP